VTERVKNICGNMGRLPAEVRAMTPLELIELVEGWNAAQSEASGQVQAPTDAEYEELVAKYG
jgi:hypothetical protein